MADPNNPYHVGAPVSGDLWVMHVSPNYYIKTGEELRVLRPPGRRFCPAARSGCAPDGDLRPAQYSGADER